MRCPNCNYICKDDSKFCENCGSKLGITNTAEPINTSSFEGKIQKKAPIIYLTINIIVFVLCLLGNIVQHSAVMEYYMEFYKKFDIPFDYEYSYITSDMVITLLIGIFIYAFMKKNYMKAVIWGLIGNLSYILYTAYYLIFVGYADYIFLSFKSVLLSILHDIAIGFLENIWQITPFIILLLLPLLAKKLADNPWMMKYKYLLAVVPALPKLYYCILSHTNTDYYMPELSPLWMAVDFLNVINIAVIALWLLSYREVVVSAADKAAYNDSVPPEIRNLRDRVIVAGNSKLFKAAIILYTIGAVLSLSGGFMITTLVNVISRFDALEYVGELLSQIIQTFNNALDNIGMNMTILMLIISLPSILSISGLWMIYSSTHSGSYDLSLAAKGCKIIRGLQIVNFILKSLMWLAIFIMSTSVSPYASWILGDTLYGIIMMCVLFALVFCIVYGCSVYINLNSAITASSSTYQSPMSSVSPFIYVCDGIFSILTFSISQILTGIATILFGMVLSYYITISSKFSTVSNSSDDQI